MIVTDYRNRPYTAEVLRVKSKLAHAFDAIAGLTVAPQNDWTPETSAEISSRLFHGYLRVPHDRPYHRTSPEVAMGDGTKMRLPRTKKVRNKDHFLYDVLIASCLDYIVVAVPFHSLAHRFFVDVDKALAGSGAKYETLNIGELVINLGPDGQTEVQSPISGLPLVVYLTKCQLAYADPKSRKRDLENIRMSGRNLGASPVYDTLIKPVLAPRSSQWTVTPVLLGLSTSVNGVKKSSITTDRHGNFKIYIGPGLRQLMRVFELLAVLDAMGNITSTTSKLPILQSQTIRDSDEQ